MACWDRPLGRFVSGLYLSIPGPRTCIARIACIGGASSAIGRTWRTQQSWHDKALGRQAIPVLAGSQGPTPTRYLLNSPTTVTSRISRHRTQRVFDTAHHTHRISYPSTASTPTPRQHRSTARPSIQCSRSTYPTPLSALCTRRLSKHASSICTSHTSLTTSGHAEQHFETARTPTHSWLQHTQISDSLRLSQLHTQVHKVAAPSSSHSISTIAAKVHHAFANWRPETGLTPFHDPLHTFAYLQHVRATQRATFQEASLHSCPAC